MGMNKVELDGRITRDGEVKYTANGNGVIKFTIAQTERKKQGNDWVDDGSSFYECEYWLHDHDNPNQFAKGQIIWFTGRLKQDQWEQDGQKRSKVKIVVKEILGWNWANSKSEANGPIVSPYEPPKAPESSPFKQDMFEDNIPF